VFSNLFSIILPNIEKYFFKIHFLEIHFSKRNYFSANKRGLIAKELICHLMRKKQKRYPLKLDFHGAFYSVILYYLDEILARMGFGDPSMSFYC
jgi:hypothetical protein